MPRFAIALISLTLGCCPESVGPIEAPRVGAIPEPEAPTRADRIAGYTRLLEATEPMVIGEPNMVSERADAIRALHELGHWSAVSPAVRRLLDDRRCVAVLETPAVASVMCQFATCGDPADWQPLEIVIATGEIKQQQC